MESIHVINERVEFCLGHVGGVETRSYLRSQTANSPPTLEGLAYAIVKEGGELQEEEGEEKKGRYVVTTRSETRTTGQPEACPGELNSYYLLSPTVLELRLRLGKYYSEGETPLFLRSVIAHRDAPFPPLCPRRD